MATLRAPPTQHQAGAEAKPPQPGEAGSESHPRSPHIHMGTGSIHVEWKHLVDMCRVELPSDSMVSSPDPPSPAPAPAPPRAPTRKGPINLKPDPKVQLAQAKRFATGVLEHYNKRRKIKLELLDAKPVNSIPEPRCCYTHINFTAKSSKEDSQEQLFFAEIYHKRRAPNGFIVTCCEPLGPDSAGGQKYRQPHEGNLAVRKNADFRFCFACSERILHPKGENYVAGHCNIPRVYGNFVR